MSCDAFANQMVCVDAEAWSSGADSRLILARRLCVVCICLRTFVGDRPHELHVAAGAGL